MEKIIKANIMHYEWRQTINNAVCYYQIPFNVALILKQASNYNYVLRDQVNMKKDV